ncbi:MAG: T9SS C-terminal target domain-containing protein [Ignavibacteriales bacterium]|nr:MAG: T9SS C-terminal target domain-containing protein [Ignavibacteriales bacterium]
MKKILLIMFIITCFGLSFSQWELRYPRISKDYIDDILFINRLTGFFVSNTGSIYKTTNGGDTWNLKANFPGENITEIKFIDELNGFAISESSFFIDELDLFFTTDGGEHWQAETIMKDADTFFPISKSEVIKFDEWVGDISKLDNFYGEWKEKFRFNSYYPDDAPYPLGQINGFQKLPDGRIIAQGVNQTAKYFNLQNDSLSFFLFSDNNGDSWDTLWCGLPIIITTSHFANNNIGWMGSDSSYIYKTTNGGLSWKLQYSDSRLKHSLKSIYAVDTSNVYAITNYGDLIYSHDGGSSWEINTTIENIYYEREYKIGFSDKEKGFIVGPEIYVINDGGKTLSRYDNSFNETIYKVDFINDKIGWALGNRNLFKSTDGGYNWSILKSDIGSYSNYGIELIDTLIGFLVTGRDIYKTTDGGKTWTDYQLNVNTSFARGIDFLDKSLGVIFEVRETCDDLTYNYVTTNGGESWEKYSINDEKLLSSFNKMKFTDPNHLWFANQQGLWLSKDTAKTWSNLKGPSVWMHAFDFSDSLHGWIISDFDTISYTSDGGKSWKYFLKPYSVQSQDLFSITKGEWDNPCAIIINYDGSIFFCNSGDTYVRHQKTNTGNCLFRATGYTKDHWLNIWAAGEGFTILHQSLYVTDVENYEGLNDIKFFLSQNFPNPFNPTTKIKFSIPTVETPHMASLRVYDILGKEIATLVNEEKPAGDYEVQFDGSGLTSGIYFYQLKAGDYVETKKFVLMK